MMATDLSKCAACGKCSEGLKTCNACKSAKYCHRGCQRAHRPEHRAECKRISAELFEEALFRRPPPSEGCPVCSLPLPIGDREKQYQACCGKTCCRGCLYANKMEAENDPDKCLVCKEGATNPSNEEFIGLLRTHVDSGDAYATCVLGLDYMKGKHALPQDTTRALELLHQAAKLGCVEAHHNLGVFYLSQFDEEKAKGHWERGAIGGDPNARYKLGVFEEKMNCNMNRAYKHYMIAASSGLDQALEMVEEGHAKGHVTKDDLEETLRAYQESIDGMESPARFAFRNAARIQSSRKIKTSHEKGFDELIKRYTT